MDHVTKFFRDQDRKQFLSLILWGCTCAVCLLACGMFAVFGAQQPQGFSTAEYLDSEKVQTCTDTVLLWHNAHTGRYILTTKGHPTIFSSDHALDAYAACDRAAT